MSDLDQIQQLKACYFRAIDQKDWPLLRQVFVDDVEIDTSDDAGDAGRFSDPDAFIAMLQAMLGEAITVHHGHMPEITIDGDAATGVWAMEDHIWFGADGPKLWGVGWYEETYRRAADGWRIATMRLRRHRVEIDGTQTFPR